MKKAQSYDVQIARSRRLKASQFSRGRFGPSGKVLPAKDVP